MDGDKESPRLSKNKFGTVLRHSSDPKIHEEL